ncbi:hypothetical protein NA56DRAFT_693233 [Hyaloscypha hepaticicola]|uniref:Uncharacterized protein n=1 Tax=Hyaloscypha hepaticicola TaxID=2082293 RepID=A0A2J6PNK8_9HELO|nr:hypothetical protein NA56DRAFT_693233 [Hyaloscypha hepaticicola]
MKLLTTLISLFAIFLLVTGSALPDLTSAPSLDANNLANRSPQNKVEGSADANAADQSSASVNNSANTGRSSNSDLLFDIETLETRQGQGSCGSPFECSIPSSANTGRSSDSDLLFDIEMLETRQGQGICGPAHLFVALFF